MPVGLRAGADNATRFGMTPQRQFWIVDADQSASKFELPASVMGHCGVGRASSRAEMQPTDRLERTRASPAPQKTDPEELAEGLAREQ